MKNIIRSTKYTIPFIIVFIMLGCAPSLESEFPDVYKEYQTLKPNKALAVVVGPNGAYAYGTGQGYDTIEQAKEAALFQCNGQQKAYQIDIPCEIRMVNDEEVKGQE